MFQVTATCQGSNLHLLRVTCTIFYTVYYVMYYWYYAHFFICIKLFELVRCQPAVHLLMLLLHIHLPDFCTAAQNVEIKHFMMLEKLNVFSALCLDD